MHPELRGNVVVEASVSPSEDLDKVARAVRNVLEGGGGEVEMAEHYVRSTSRELDSLKHLRDQLRDRRVRGAARRLLLRDRVDNRTKIMLNRQAAFAGVLAVCGNPGESPLGPIYLTVESDQLDSVIDWLTAYEGG